MSETKGLEIIKFGDRSGIDLGCVLVGACLLFLMPVMVVNLTSVRGMGYYACGGSIFLLCYLFSLLVIPYGVTTAAAPIAAKERYRDMFEFAFRMALYALAAGVLFGLICFFTANAFTKTIFKAPAGAVTVKMLLPTLILLPVLGVCRGTLQTLHEKRVLLLGQIIELSVDLAAGYAFSKILYEKGWQLDVVKEKEVYRFAYGAGGAALGLAVGAAICLLLYAVVLFRRYSTLTRRRRKSLRMKNYDPYRKAFRNMLAAGVPVLFIGIIPLFSQSIVGGYMVKTMEQTSYVAEWGMFAGCYLSLLPLPVLLVMLLGMQVIPVVKGRGEVGSEERRTLVSRMNLALRTGSIFGFPASLVLPAIALPLISTVFPTLDDTSVPLIFICAGCPLILIVAMTGITSMILLAIGEQDRLVVQTVGCFCLFILVSEFLMRVTKLGIYSAEYGFIIFGLVLTSLNIMKADAVLRTRQEWKRNYLMPLLISLLATAIAGGSVYAMNGKLPFAWITLVLGFLIFCAVVLIGYILMHIYNAKDLSEFPHSELWLSMYGLLYGRKAKDRA